MGRPLDPLKSGEGQHGEAMARRAGAPGANGRRAGHSSRGGRAAAGGREARQTSTRAYASPRNFLVEGIGVCGNTNINISAPQCELDGFHDNILREEARHGREVEGLPWRWFRTRLHVLNELAGLRGNLHSPVVAVAAHVVLDAPMKAGSDDKNRCLRGWQVSRC